MTTMNNNTLLSFPATQQPDYNLASTHRLEQHQEETTRNLYFSKTGSTPSTTLQFRILVANDISKDVHNILKIAQSMGKVNALHSDPRIDAVLLTGGLASPASRDDATSKTTLNHISNKEGEVMTVLSRFEQIKRRVFYIPGPSDPISLYARDAVATDTTDTTTTAATATASLPHTSSHRNAIPELNNQPPHLTLRSVNVHNWWVEIEEGVIIAGVGDMGHDGGGTDAEDNDNGKHSQSCQQQCHTVLDDAIHWWQEKNNKRLQETEQLAQQQHVQGQGQGQGPAPEEKQQQEPKEINGATPDIKHPQIIFMTNVVSMKDVLRSPSVQDSLLLCVHGGAGGRASSGGNETSGTLSKVGAMPSVAEHGVGWDCEGTFKCKAAATAATVAKANLKGPLKPDLLKASRSTLTVPIIKVESLSRNGKYSIIDFSRTAIEAPWTLDRVTEHDVTKGTPKA